MNAVRNNHDDHDHDENQSSFDIRKANIPVVMIFGIVGFFMWVTWVANNERNVLSNRLDSIESKLISMSEKIKDLHLKEPDYNAWISKYDFRLWCLEAQLMNPNFKCPAIQNVPGAPGTLNKLNEGDILRELEKTYPRIPQGQNAPVP